VSNFDPAAALTILSRHIGRGSGISAKQMAQQLGINERHVRHHVEVLRKEGNAICGHPRDGYYIAATAEELDSTCEFLYARAMCSLAQISYMKKIPMPDLRGQLHLPT
jgi:biotin operon repressor